MKKNKFLLIGLSLIILGIILAPISYNIWLRYKVSKTWTSLSLYSYKNSPEEVNFKSDGLNLSAYLYKSEFKNGSAIVLVHGLNSLGKDFPLYRIISDKLVDKGFIVLSIDLRGFNKSDDPKSVQNLNDINFSNDIFSAIIYLVKEQNVDSKNIFVAGHSMGAGSTLYAVEKDSSNQIKAAISIEADRSGRIQNYQGFADRLEKEFEVDYEISKNALEELTPHINTEFLSDSIIDHCPILFIDTERAERHLNLMSDYKKFTDPKELRIIKNTYHYFGTYKGSNWKYKQRIYRYLDILPFTPDAICNEPAVDNLTNVIVDFIERRK